MPYEGRIGQLCLSDVFNNIRLRFFLHRQHLRVQRWR
jgi:hypothetical protein